ncbi:enamine deaminase RidA (YjgF/YER057c/UK114 family) [Ochrobactrum daejeonense]|uniref:Enamine deaminase RidA (YjgF/YER057c/UK114 family) n=1 Tax=Brucella daejeonensis TaxID=659015 RepID=A0A7W9B0D3_9HYPH|nr:RidA family protein [Brucella daejeonensis]MBB5703916.1 enamine deaminase RidA (YjgF/YER057c/UK114 family) [Brucella daejeonensis]
MPTRAAPTTPQNRTGPYERLAALGIELPEAPPPIANFVTHVQEGNILFLSGQGPREMDGRLHTGKVGDDLTAEDAYSHARLTGINLLAVMHHALGDLNRIKRIVKLFGMVNAAPEFGDHPRVINGCSDLFIEVFGDCGHHARSAVGQGSLPGNITVEIEAIVSLKDEAAPDQ